ncbi:MAG: hypothetical protein CVU05_13515 [Bacteroidetes bacterium HGW-Bacteroidetes-21]|jgi:hypothetical protein|nr:MAG: hypothetical protein CVU05_13515 [Bacteroidetes bacterium HGW-Bacteroidetes-21]
MRFRVALLLFLFIQLNSFSQWDCRSILGGHLHPVFTKKSPFSAGLEATLSQGWMNDRSINNFMLFSGINLSLGKNHLFYAEGGFKGWNYMILNTEIAEGKPENFKKNRMGIREGFYKYTGLNSSFTVGFQSINLGDLWLVNERALGVKYSQSFGKTGFDFAGATVLRDFSRMGSYCTVKYIYNLIKHRPDAYVGNDPGETNFAGIVWWFNSEGEKNIKQGPVPEGNDEFKPVDGQDDEFKPVKTEGGEFKPVKTEDDEFKPIDNGEEFKPISNEGEDDDFKEMTPQKNAIPFFKLSKHGAVLYSEFGSGISSEKLWYGYMLTGNLLKKIAIKTQVLHQLDNNNQMAIAMAGISYNHTCSSPHVTQIGINTYHSIAIDQNSRVSASFTNFFIGEVLRMESQDMPLSQFYVKHYFPGKQKIYLKAQHVLQYQGNKMAESDLECGAKLFHHFRLTGIMSRITANSLNEPYYMLRVELRMAI